MCWEFGERGFQKRELPPFCALQCWDFLGCACKGKRGYCPVSGGREGRGGQERVAVIRRATGGLSVGDPAGLMPGLSGARVLNGCLELSVQSSFLVAPTVLG